MSGGGGSPTVGFKYYLGIHMVLCHGPIDNITRVIVDGKDAWTGVQGDGTLTISAENLFGGEDREGGVSGSVDIQLGSTTQTANGYLVSKLGSMVPGYRGVVGAILKQCYVGMNPYIKRWAFRAQRIHTRQNGIIQWYDAKAAIGSDMNPAHIIRECLTDPNWGMGYNDYDIDDTAFMAAADTMYSEGMGMSLLWDKSKDIGDFIQDVLSHIQGSLFVSRSTGRFVLKLVRADYVVANLLTLDEDNVSKITEFKRSTVGELVNSVTVIYWDASTGKDGSVTVQDIALVAQQQSVISTTKQYPGFTTGANAARAASTELRALSTPLASATVYTNRVAAAVNIGDCIILSWMRYGVVSMVCRVTNVELGSIGSNLVKLTVVEDVFSQAASVYAAPPVSGWVDPNSTPLPCPYHCVMETPYWDIVKNLGETDARSLPSTSAFFTITGVRPTSDARNAKLFSDPSLQGYEEKAPVNFCPSATISVAVNSTDTVWAISGGVDLDLVKLKTYAVIDSEIVSVIAVSGSSITVGRGCLDTVPALHSSLARIYFAEEMMTSDGVEYAFSEVCRYKLLPTTGKGTLAIGSAVMQSATATNRQAKPYPPGSLRINSLNYPDAVSGDSTVSISWVHRDRLQQTVYLVDTTVGNIGPEVGTTYTVSLATEAGSVFKTYTGLTGLTQLFSLVDLGSNYGRIRVQLKSTRDGLDSHQTHDFKFTRAGYGTAYGYAYGGA